MISDSVTIILRDSDEGEFFDFRWQFMPAIPEVGEIFVVNNYGSPSLVVYGPERTRYRVLAREIEYRVHLGGGNACLVILTVEPA